MVGANAIDSDRPIRIVDVPGFVPTRGTTGYAAVPFRSANSGRSKTRINTLVAALAGTTRGAYAGIRRPPIAP
jgi:hypothetical protein